MVLSSKSSPVLNRQAADRYDHLNEHLNEGVNGIRVVKSFVLEQRRVQGYSSRISVFIAASRRLLHFSAIHLPLPQLLVATTVHAWVFGWGLYWVQRDDMPVGLLTAALMTMTGLVFRLDGINRSFAFICRGPRQRSTHLAGVGPRYSIGKWHYGTYLDGPLRLELRDVDVRGILQNCSLTLSQVRLRLWLVPLPWQEYARSLLCARHRDPDGGEVLIHDQQQGSYSLP